MISLAKSPLREHIKIVESNLRSGWAEDDLLLVVVHIFERQWRWSRMKVTILQVNCKSLAVLAQSLAVERKLPQQAFIIEILSNFSLTRDAHYGVWRK